MTDSPKCSDCNTELKEGKTEFRFGIIVFHDVDCLKCPKCGKITFTSEQKRKISDIIVEFDRTTCYHCG
ncbi:MAG: YgiT-type zinc finger protein [Promethearchaeota archaeon]